MPAYNTLTPPPSLMPGDERYLLGLSVAAGTGPTPGIVQAPNDANIVFEAAAAGVASQQVTLATRPSGGAPGLMVQVIANADPGVSRVDIQEAAIDTTGSYIVPAVAAYQLTVWAAMGDGKFVAWTQLQPDGARFLRLKVVSNPNAVSWAAKVVYV